MNKETISIQIIPVKSLDNNILEYNYKSNLNSISNKITNLSNDKSVKDERVYVYGNLSCVVNNNNKRCYEIDFLNSQLINNFIIIKFNIKEISLDSFPFIEKYDKIITRNINKINDHINLIKEYDKLTKESVCYFELNNENSLTELVKIIKGISL